MDYSYIYWTTPTGLHAASLPQWFTLENEALPLSQFEEVEPEEMEFTTPVFTTPVSGLSSWEIIAPRTRRLVQSKEPLVFFALDRAVPSALRIKRYECIHDPETIERNRVVCLEECTWRHHDYDEGFVLASSPFSPCGEDRFVIPWENARNGMPYLSITLGVRGNGGLDGNEPLKHDLEVVAIDTQEAFESWTHDALTGWMIDTCALSGRIVRHWHAEEPMERGGVSETRGFIDLYQF